MIFFTVHFSIIFWLVVFLNFSQGSVLSLNWLSLAILTGCGGELSGPTGSFSSPGYPNTYPPNKECLWYITTAPGSSIQLTIHDFDVEYHAMCNFDALEVGIQIAYQHVPSTPEFGVELEITLQNSLNYFQWPVVFFVQTFQQVSILCEWCWWRNGINNLILGFPKSRVWRTWWQAIQLGDGTRKQAWGDSRRWGERGRASEGAPEGHSGGLRSHRDPLRCHEDCSSDHPSKGVTPVPTDGLHSGLLWPHMSVWEISLRKDSGGEGRV